MKSSLLVKLLGASVLAFGLGAAQAATCTAVNAFTNPDATLTNSDVCGSGPNGDQNANATEVADAYGSLTWTQLGKTDEDLGPLSFSGEGETSGSWGFDAVFPYTDYIIVLKDGTTNGGPLWFWFHIDLSGGCSIGDFAGTLDYCGTWTMYGTGGNAKELSHGELWAANSSSGGDPGSGDIPEPSSTGLLALMGLGLIVASFRARRKS